MTKETAVHLPRRRFIQTASLLAGTSVVPQAIAAPTDLKEISSSLRNLFTLLTKGPEAEQAAIERSRPKDVRSISLYNLHTGEKSSVDYWIDGQYEKEALAEINKVLRDHRNDAVCEINCELIDYLSSLQQKLDLDGKTFEVISGYRSPATNAKLRQKSRGVAKESFHMKGMAIDVQIPGTSSDLVFNAAKELKVGGAGYYGNSRFVHLDVGGVRSWRG